MKGSIIPLTMALKHPVEGPEEEMLTRGGSISAGIRKLGSLIQKEHYEMSTQRKQPVVGDLYAQESGGYARS